MKNIESHCFNSAFSDNHTAFFHNGETDSNTYVGIFKEGVKMKPIVNEKWNSPTICRWLYLAYVLISSLIHISMCGQIACSLPLLRLWLHGLQGVSSCIGLQDPWDHGRYILRAQQFMANVLATLNICKAWFQPLGKWEPSIRPCNISDEKTSG